MDQYKKRDANIELIRDIGMLSVIMLHCLCIFPNQCLNYANIEKNSA